MRKRIDWNYEDSYSSLIAGANRQQAGDSPATTARGKPDPSPLTGTDWLSNESSLKRTLLLLHLGNRVQRENNREHIMESTIVDGAWKGHLGRGLAPRELQFVLSVAQGLTAKEIARVFGIAPGTVVKRLANAMFKLGVHRQGALVAEAMRRQIITPLCLLLAGLIAIHTATDDQLARRDRRPTERRFAEMRLIRRAEAVELIG